MPQRAAKWHGFFSRRGIFFLIMVMTILGTSGAFFFGDAAHAANYVALFPSSEGQTCADNGSRLGTLLEAHNLSAQTREVFPHLQGALLDLEASQKEALLREIPGTVLISSARTFRHCAEEAEPSTKKSVTPWHVLWASYAGLTEGISSYAWDSVVIAVMDTGVNRHRDFSEALIYWSLGYNTLTGISGTEEAVYDDQGHGTTVTGTIVGRETGITPQVGIIPIKCADSSGYSSTEDLAKSVDYLLGLLSGPLANRHLICNFSFATSGNTFYRDEEMEMFFKTLFDRISAAGGLFFAAAGNENQNVNQRYVYPSRISSQIFLAVAGTTETGHLATSFSNYGDRTIDIATPGNAIVTTLRDGESLQSVNGTSFASPIAAATAAALWARNRDLVNWQVRNVLLNAVDTPLWTAGNSMAPAASVAVISGGDMAPEKLRESFFVNSTKGIVPKALNLVNDSEENSLGGGCHVGATEAPALLLMLLPLAGFCIARKF
ncbi:MAG TPA: S8 family serine peptidase [Synergistaceae bacterium]|nr:S8 family serine peptidase [Synergistaceae bacterium]